MSKIKTFLHDSQAGYVLKISATTLILIKKGSYKIKSVLHCQSTKHCLLPYARANSASIVWYRVDFQSEIFREIEIV